MTLQKACSGLKATPKVSKTGIESNSLWRPQDFHLMLERMGIMILIDLLLRQVLLLHLNPPFETIAKLVAIIQALVLGVATTIQALELAEAITIQALVLAVAIIIQVLVLAVVIIIQALVLVVMTIIIIHRNGHKKVSCFMIHHRNDIINQR